MTFYHFTGFEIYQVEDSALQSKAKLDQDFFAKNQRVDASSFSKDYEITRRFKLRPGSYAVIPCTFDPNKEGEFLLRIFSEKGEATRAKRVSHIEVCKVNQL